MTRHNVPFNEPPATNGTSRSRGRASPRPGQQTSRRRLSHTACCPSSTTTVARDADDDAHALLHLTIHGQRLHEARDAAVRRELIGKLGHSLWLPLCTVPLEKDLVPAHAYAARLLRRPRAVVRAMGQHQHRYTGRTSRDAALSFCWPRVLPGEATPVELSSARGRLSLPRTGSAGRRENLLALVSPPPTFTAQRSASHLAWRRQPGQPQVQAASCAAAHREPRAAAATQRPRLGPRHSEAPQ